MGSGKGQARRTRTSAVVVPSTGVSYDWKKWKEFVQSSGMNTVSLYRYYLGKNLSSYMESDHEKVIKELFSDVVAVGALTLPGPYLSEDFVFRMAPGASSRAVRIFVSPDKSERFRSSYYVNVNDFMADIPVDIFFAGLAADIKRWL